MKSKVTVFYLISLVLTAVFFMWFLSNDIFVGDDISEIVNLSQNTAKYNIDGLYTSVLTKLFCVKIPLLLNIHPHQFSMTAGAFVRGFNIAVLCGVISLFLFIGRNKKFYLALGTLFSAFYFCYASSNLTFMFDNILNIPHFETEGSFVLLTEYTHHFGQIFSLILGLGFIYVIADCFINNKIFDKKYLIPVSLLGFFCASSSLYVVVITTVMLLFIFIYYLTLNLIINKKPFSDIKNELKSVLYPVVSYVLGNILFYYYTGFNRFEFADSLLSGAKTVIKTLMFAVPLETATLFILSAVVYFMALNKTTYIKRAVFFALAVISGICSYICLFSAKGESFTINLVNSVILIRLTMLCLVFLLLGTCLKELSDEPKVKKFAVSVFLVIYGLFSAVQIPFVFTTMVIWRAINEENKVTMYCIEKIYRFNSLLGQTAVLPEDALLRIMKINAFVNDYSVKDKQITKDTVFKYTDFTTGYYQTFYKNPRIVPYRFDEPVSAVKKFMNDGGHLTKDELIKADFQKLYDENFVIGLNNKVR